MIYCSYQLPHDKKYHCFLAHNCANGNHERVSKVYRALKDRGFIPWFDEKELKGQIRDEMSNGIYSSCTFVIFITELYESKVNSNTMGDHCYYEFNAASQYKPLVDLRIPVAMEVKMSNPDHWAVGRLRAELGTSLIIDMTNDTDVIFEQQVDILSTRINEMLSHYAPPATIPLKSLRFVDIVDLLVDLGCPANIHAMLVYYIYSDDELFEEYNLSRSKIQEVRGIFDKLKKLKQTGILIETMRNLREKRGRHSGRVFTLMQLSDGRIASGSNDETIKIWNVSTGECEKTFTGHDNDGFPLIQLSDRRIASGCNNKTINIWNVNTGACDMRLKGHSNSVRTLIQLSGSDGRIASGSVDNTIKIWNVNSGVCEMTLTGHSELVGCIIQLLDGRIASGSDDRTIKIWNVGTGKCEKTLNGQRGSVLSLIQLTDGSIASFCCDETIQIWDVNTGAWRLNFKGHSDRVLSLIQLSDGRIASGSNDGTIKIWNVKHGVLENTLEGHNGCIFTLIQLSDGRIASGSSDATVKLWNVKSSVCDMTFERHSASVVSLIQLSDGRIASGSEDETIKIWSPVY